MEGSSFDNACARGPGRSNAGIPEATMHSALDDAPRNYGWMFSEGTTLPCRTADVAPRIIVEWNLHVHHVLPHGDGGLTENRQPDHIMSHMPYRLERTMRPRLYDLFPHFRNLADSQKATSKAIS